MRWGIVAVLVTALWLTAGAAVASAEWKQPQVVNRPGTYATGPKMVTTPLGEVVTVWVEQADASPFPMRMVSRVVRADGVVEPAVEIAGELAGCVLDLTTDALGNVIASWQLPDGTIKVARRAPGGVFGPPQIVAKPENGGSPPVIASNARGDIALMWAQFRPHETWGQWTHFVAVSRGGGSFGAPVQIEPWRPVATGGYDVALTPAGEVVGVWAANPEREPERDTYGDPARVETATLTAAGLVTPVQKLAEFDGAATCPELAADAQGRLAALWHEIHTDYCAVWGRDMIALRRSGIQFEPPVEVPTSRGNVSRGELEVSDGGDITVAFSDQDGGEVVRGSFDSPLTVAVPQFPAQSTPSMGGNEGGDVLFGSDGGSHIQTARLRDDGTMEAPQDLRADCANVGYAQLDVNRNGLAAAAMMVDGGDLELTTDGPADAPGPRNCNSSGAWVGPGGDPGSPAPGGNPGGESSPPGSSGAPPVGPAASGFGLNVDRSSLTGKGAKRRLKVRVSCGVSCTASLQAKLIGRDGRRLDRATAKRSLARGSGWLAVNLDVPKRRRPKHASVRIVATDQHGNVLVRKLAVAARR
ncbi:MAG: hypothetical protein M3340_10335 [Actinomycetota bacterium]|nr:hypothetical protein [Actinomycetota bacterium]